MSIVSVELPGREYEIVVEKGALARCGSLISELKMTGKIALISDTNVEPLHGAAVRESLEAAGYEVTLHVVTAGEASKSMAQVNDLCSEMILGGHDRSSFVVALGGGVVGDLAGFVASVFYRGIPFVQIPTTIVAQVDSAVGGKTGVNTPEGKNLIGAFHQPKLVVTDPEVLQTLPSREYREGYAEVIKHAGIRDAAMLDELMELDPADQCPPEELIARNVAIKARVVEEDEKETAGTRALLNFGHTIGHGIEASVPYGTLLHGEAISLGLRAAVALSEEVVGLPSADGAKVLQLLTHFGLPTQLSEEVKTATILEKMSRDKKFSGGKMTFVLIDRAGNGVLSKVVTLAMIEAAIENLRTELA